MAENSDISWTDNSLNFGLGCNEVRIHVGEAVALAMLAQSRPIVTTTATDGKKRYYVSSECDQCYAREWARRRKGYDDRDAAHPKIWGNPKLTPRIQTKYWRGAMRKWERAATVEGRPLVFVESLGDWAEEHPMLTPWRSDFLELAERCTHLDLLLLTKRPQNALRYAPDSWKRSWPQHVWLGTSAGTQAAWDLRVPYLDEWAAIGVPVRFVSIEPMLEAIEPDRRGELRQQIVNWGITGGESGPDAGYAGSGRPRINADKAWFTAMRDAYVDSEVAFFHKQHGGRGPGGDAHLDGREWHQWPDTGLGPLAGVRTLPGAELIPSRVRSAA